LRFPEHHSYWYPQVVFVDGGSPNLLRRSYGGALDDPDIEFTGAKVVPVSIVGEGQLSDSENSFVPQGDGCILMNTRGLERMFDTFNLDAKRNPKQFSDYERALMVSVMLLHEIGHLYYEDQNPSGPHSKDVNGNLLSPTDIEIRADR